MTDDVSSFAPPPGKGGGATSFLLALVLLQAACGGSAANVMQAAGAPAAAGMGGAAGMPAADGGAGRAGSAVAGAGGNGSGMSFAEVYERVITKSCGACHNDAPSFGGLAFFPGGAATAYANLVGVPAGQQPDYRCHDSGLLRVKPGDPEHSLIYLKLTAPPCGSKMPPAAFGTANEEQVELVRAWIASGAAP